MRHSALLVRLLAVALTALAAWRLPGTGYWLPLVFALGLGHYALGYYYSRHRIVALARRPDAVMLAVTTVGLGALLYWSGFSLIILFGLHHALNEGYFRRRSENAEIADTLSPGRALLHFLSYLVILGGSLPLRGLPVAALYIALALAVLYYLYQLWRLPQRGSLWQSHQVELLSLVFVGISLWVNISFLQVVLYHFILWTLLPLPDIFARSKAETARYLALTVSVTGLFLMVSPVGLGGHYQGLVGLFASQFYFWSYLHITTSFVLSDCHPRWITQPLQSAAPVSSG